MAITTRSLLLRLIFIYVFNYIIIIRNHEDEGAEIGRARKVVTGLLFDNTDPKMITITPIRDNYNVSNHTNNNKPMASTPAGAKAMSGHDEVGEGTNPENQTLLSESAPCFRRDPERVQQLLQHHHAWQNKNRISLPKPVVYLGLPKVGSTTLFDFFRCSGWKASHWATIRDASIGLCMQRAVMMKKQRGVLKSCDAWHHYAKDRNRNSTHDDFGAEAYLQMDFIGRSGRKHCVFPQMQYLDQIHQDSPNATFILSFRPIQDWARSMLNWNSMKHRLTRCHLPPRLPRGKGRSVDDLMQWWCWHVNRVRSFVDRNPSHALVELDLYETEETANVMAALFGSKKECWGHSNANAKLISKGGNETAA